ncbi:uncharacterized protein LAESUDRAFT_716570 [Laetiporus sulphureus 93-53]|uniref:Uncharacterized protein n=1 Tax=Laetiporus sulphureus 93-53 TaxID=1314785 RepID=A0A165CGV7_9APHY|nr:uncharacterized protein LAESUDRAFT_716570 [Laetiporus sulphureus 93-53]KZT02784.1 hypothetical protein LAESUDRAFT_716570 [Laetiporus sulphureus 93-53]
MAHSGYHKNAAYDQNRRRQLSMVCGLYSNEELRRMTLAPTPNRMGVHIRWYHDEGALEDQRHGDPAREIVSNRPRAPPLRRQAPLTDEQFGAMISQLPFAILRRYGIPAPVSGPPAVLDRAPSGDNDEAAAMAVMREQSFHNSPRNYSDAAAVIAWRDEVKLAGAI